MSKPNCDCAHPVAKGSALDVMTRGVARQLAKYCADNGCSQTEALDRLTSKTSTTLAARVPKGAAREVKRTAAALGVTPGEYLRRAIVLLAKGKTAATDPEKILEQVALDLNLPQGATPEQIVEALQAVVASLEAPPAPAPAVPAPAPAAPPVFASRMTIGGKDAGASSIARARTLSAPGSAAPGGMTPTDRAFRDALPADSRAVYDRQIAARAQRAAEARSIDAGRAANARRNAAAGVPGYQAIADRGGRKI